MQCNCTGGSVQGVRPPKVVSCNVMYCIVMYNVPGGSVQVVRILKVGKIAKVFKVLRVSKMFAEGSPMADKASNGV